VKPTEYHPTSNFSPPTLIHGVDFNTAETLEYIKEVELLTEDQCTTLDELGGLRKVGRTFVFDFIRDYFREETGLKDRFEMKVELSGRVVYTMCTNYDYHPLLPPERLKNYGEQLRLLAGKAPKWFSQGEFVVDNRALWEE